MQYPKLQIHVAIQLLEMQFCTPTWSNCSFMSYKIEPTRPPTNLNHFFFLFLLFFLGEISRWVHKPISPKEFINQLFAKHSFQNAFIFCQLRCRSLLLVVFISPPTCASNTVVFFY
jgi:hypothetical protein